MTIDLSVSELPSPVLEFGGAASGSDLKEGLLSAGPFDMRFGSARPDKISVGLVGPGELIDSAVAWLDRCEDGIGALREGSKLRRSFDGFSSVFPTGILVPNATAKISPWRNASFFLRAKSSEKSLKPSRVSLG